MRQDSVPERLLNGIVKENPTFVLMLGMCPTLAVTTSAVNGLGMGLTTTAVLMLSNLIISLLRKVIPDKVRIPAFIVIIASFVTVLQLLLEAYLPSLNEALGVYIPLIVVNCIILGRAEAYAYSHGPLSSLFDGIGMGLGFTVALTAIGMVRELLGAGELFGRHVMPEGFVPIGIFVLAPGAFFVLAALSALQNFLKLKGEKKGKDMSKVASGCGMDCLHCAESGCETRTAEAVAEPAKEAEDAAVTGDVKDEPKQETIKKEPKPEAKEEPKAEARGEIKVKEAVKPEAEAEEEPQTEEIKPEISVPARRPGRPRKPKAEAEEPETETAPVRKPGRPRKPKTDVKEEVKTEVKEEPQAEAEEEPQTEKKAEPEMTAPVRKPGRPRKPKTEAEEKPRTEAAEKPKTEAEEDARPETKEEPKADIKEPGKEAEKPGKRKPGRPRKKPVEPPKEEADDWTEILDLDKEGE